MKKCMLVLLAVLSLLGLVSCSKKLDWPDGKLGRMIPPIEDAKGEIEYEYLDSLYVTLENVSESQYLDYTEQCQSYGFSVDVLDEGDSFIAFNADGYKIKVSYLSYNEMWIMVDAPISMSTFKWPSSDIAKLIPETTSNYGKIEWEAEYGFVIYVGNTTKSEYDEYVNSVYSAGFTVDYSKGNNYFYADNVDGFSVSIKYEGFNTMFVSLDEPDEIESDRNNTNAENPDTNNGNDDYNDNGTGDNNNTDESNSNSNELINGMRPEFKEAMDSYEAFFDEYVAFMKKYNSSTNSMGMMADYMSFLSRYTETMDKLEKMGDEEMNATESLYYSEVMFRITNKLLEI